jgi:hypothetical protein
MGKYTTINLPKSTQKLLQEMKKKHIKEAEPGGNLKLVAMDDGSYVNWILMEKYKELGFELDLEGSI